MDVIYESRMMWYKSKFQAFPGKIIITKDRFTFLKVPKWTMMFGALSALFMTTAKGIPMIDDEISNLKFSRGRDVGKKAFMLVITTPDGKSYDFLFDDETLAKLEGVITLEDMLAE